MKVLVVTAAGLRPDYLGCYGCDWVDTPNIDQLAAAGVVFDNHHAVQPDSEGSSLAWRTGNYYCDRLSMTEQPNESATKSDLLAWLDRAGVNTALIADADRPPPKSFLQGWHKVQTTHSVAALLDSVKKTLKQAVRKDNALIWIDIPFLVPPWEIPTDFLQSYFGSSQEEEDAEGEPDVDDEPVIPLLNPPCGVNVSLEDEELERLQNTYAAGIGHFDSILGQIFELLAHVDPDDEWLLIVTSPHGLALGEHKQIGSTTLSLHEEHIHVPLLMRLPGGAEAGRRTSALTQTVDLPATFCEAFGIRSVDWDGFSLLSLANGKSEINRPFSISSRHQGEESTWALRTPEWKLIISLTKDGAPVELERQLYAKPQDRWEANNVAQHHHELMDELEQRLRAFIETRELSGRPMKSASA
jgi:arylsulfatase A-like enzyme